ncbi:uncharacterized protein M6B38_134380 [Iris pallida]|uniref:Uncharacterized protein n=1 Tax=Iris pallida TaxID=29817 RepID=A0AAX6FHC9_IRIPA|nr:uncharacterized protein M6B38_134380 [Iris pallida]
MRGPGLHSLIEYVQRRVEGWQAAGLSFGGRIELVRSVISAVAIFVQSILLPVATIRGSGFVPISFGGEVCMRSPGTSSVRPRKEGGVGSDRCWRLERLLRLSWPGDSAGGLSGRTGCTADT